MSQASFNRKRIGAGVLTLALLFAAANHYLEWHIFGRFGGAVMMAVALVMIVYLVRVGPTLEELLAHREAKSRIENRPFQLRLWVFCLTLALAMLALFVLLGPGLQLIRGEAVAQRDWIKVLIVEVVVVVVSMVNWYRMKRLVSKRADRV